MPARRKPVADVAVVAVVEPVAPEVVVSERKSRVVSAASPRAVRSEYDEAKSVSDVRKLARRVGRSVGVFTTIVEGIGRSKNGVYKYNGKEYTKDDIPEMKRAIASGIADLPMRGVVASKAPKEPVALPQEERDARFKARRLRFEEGATELFRRIVRNKDDAVALSRALVAKSEARCGKADPPKVASKSQVGARFLVSDQFASFCMTGNFGNGIAMLFPNISPETLSVEGASNPKAAYDAVAAELGEAPEHKLGVSKESIMAIVDPRIVIAPLILDEGVSNPALMMILMFLYIRVNKLRRENGRISTDSNMRINFGKQSDTRWVFHKKDYTPPELAESAKKCGFDRLLDRKIEDGEEVPYDGTTFMRRMSIALANFYRVKTDDAEVNARLTSPDVANLVEGVKMFLR